MGLAGAFGIVRRLAERLAPLKWLAFAACLVFFGLGALTAALEEAGRYAELREADWIPTNVWVESAECARVHGVWLAVCDDDKLVPKSEYAFGDDPGHALFLGVWAMATDDMVWFDDVARLNVGLNTAGFVLLASFLFAIRAYVTSIVFVLAGPIIYLGWIGVSPHWSFIGVASMALVLPMALIAREHRFLSPWLGNAYVTVGLLGLAAAALVREPIGLMGFVISSGVVAALMVHQRRSTRRLRDLLVVGSLVLVAAGASTWVVWTRDALFEMEPAQRVATHSFSHTLYIGLGAVPNAFGLSYEDEVARASVESVAPHVLNSSPEYYRILWKLYWDKVTGAPEEVLRIYLEKAKLILADRILDSAPPLGLVLAFAVVHLAVATKFGMWRRIAFSQGLLLASAAVVFISLFVAQATLAHPNRVFAMPVGAALLMLLGTMLEFCWRFAMVFVRRIERKELTVRRTPPRVG
jgi:hypothetical protein